METYHPTQHCLLCGEDTVEKKSFASFEDKKQIFDTRATAQNVSAMVLIPTLQWALASDSHNHYFPHILPHGIPTLAMTS